MTAQAATPRQTGVLGRLEPRGGDGTEGELRGAGRRAAGQQPEPVLGTTWLLTPGRPLPQCSVQNGKITATSNLGYHLLRPFAHSLRIPEFVE